MPAPAFDCELMHPILGQLDIDSGNKQSWIASKKMPRIDYLITQPSLRIERRSMWYPDNNPLQRRRCFPEKFSDQQDEIPAAITLRIPVDGEMRCRHANLPTVLPNQDIDPRKDLRRARALAYSKVQVCCAESFGLRAGPAVYSAADREVAATRPRRRGLVNGFEDTVVWIECEFIGF